MADSTVHGEPGLATPGAKSAAAELLALQGALLPAVITRVGEVEAVEWALNQAKAACDVQIAAPLAAGVSAETVAAVAGDQTPDLNGFVEDRQPQPADG